MGAITTMMIDYGDYMYKYTPQGYTAEVKGERLLAGGPRVNTYGMEDFRLDLRYWEIDKKDVSENGEWQTLYFRKRQREDIVIVKDRLSEKTEVYNAFGYEKVDGKYYIFSDSVGTEVLDGSDWAVRRIAISYPSYEKQAIIFTRKSA